MLANPGGYIEPDEVIGRDRLIQHYWRILRRQSLILSAERRMGKTCIIRKMATEYPVDVVPISRDLEGLRTPMEFARAVFEDVQEHLGRWNRATNRVFDFLSKLGGIKIGDIFTIPELARHWKPLLTSAIEDLMEAQAQEETAGQAIFFWDELPLMIYNIKQREDESTAMELLDTLRSSRQSHSQLRMVYTGSIGLHNVLVSLKRAGSASDPTNDMRPEEVPPLSADAGAQLAMELLDGEAIPADDRDALACAICEVTDGIPFYIHHVVDELTQYDVDPVQPGHAKQVIHETLTDSRDPVHFRHYRERIDTYYDSEQIPLALALLDALAAAETPLPFDELWNRAKHTLQTEDIENARDMLALLQKDHYVIRSPDGNFRFRFGLMKRWWCLDRGLSS